MTADQTNNTEEEPMKQCRSCEENWGQDDFWCPNYKNLCLNCCPCAFGMAKPTANGKCAKINTELIKHSFQVQSEQDPEIPF